MSLGQESEFYIGMKKPTENFEDISQSFVSKDSFKNSQQSK